MDVWVLTVNAQPPTGRPVLLRRYCNVEGRTFFTQGWDCASPAEAYHLMPGDRQCVRRDRVGVAEVEIWV